MVADHKKALRLRFAIGSLLIAAVLSAPAWAAKSPNFSVLPTVSTTPLIADDATRYTVTATAADDDGYNDLRTIRIIFDYGIAQGDQTKGRGFLNWGKTDADVTLFGGTWTIANATGGGRWGYATDIWSGTTYITPLSCQTSVAGLSTSGRGTRTVTFTFTVKPAWGSNPTMNEADGWVMDGGNHGDNTCDWESNWSLFDVLPTACTNTCATPHAPVLSGSTTTFMYVAINPADSSLDQYAIAVSPSFGGRMFLQDDGTLGVVPVSHGAAAWGTKAVTGLMWNTTYSFFAKAMRTTTGWCPSPWGPAAQAMTLNPTVVLDYQHGTPFSPWVRGQCPHREIPAGDYPAIWSMTAGSLARGIGGGLDADTYDWRNVLSGMPWGASGYHVTSLEYLQFCRDYNATPLITANIFGGGGFTDSANPTWFVCQTANPDGLAADQVRYTNVILPNYRQGDEGLLTNDNLRVYNSITGWEGKARLLPPTAAAVPRVTYWEIGNEPEYASGNGLENHYLGPADYRDRYKLMTAAMSAVDPTIKVGPCFMTPTDSDNPSNQWLQVLAADPAARIDFVSYHPYYWNIREAWGVTNCMTAALCNYKAFLNNQSAAVRSILAKAGRSGAKLIVSEWNPMYWDNSNQMFSSMAMALALAEGCFTFAENGVDGSAFWDQPEAKFGPAALYPEIVAHMGDTLITSGSQLGLNNASTDFRFYVTRPSTSTTTLMIWGLNFNETQTRTVTLSIPDQLAGVATLKHLGVSGGTTSLMSYLNLAWNQQDVTTSLRAENFDFVMPPAQITLLILQISPAARADFDGDGDVDQSDFGHLQACLSGSTVPQNDPICQDAKLNTDAYVDRQDVQVFLSCRSGSRIPADPGCGR